MIKAVITELDGVLLKDDKAHQEDTLINKLKNILDKNIDIIYVTDRNVAEMISLDKMWFLPVYMIGMDGSFILDNEKNIMLNNVVDPAIVDYLSTVYKDYPLEYLGGYMRYATVSKEAFVNHSMKFFDEASLSEFDKQNFIQALTYKMGFNVKAEAFREDGIYQIGGLFEDEKTYLKLKDEISNLTDSLTSVTFDGVAMEIKGYRLNKKIALDMLLDTLGYKKDEVLILCNNKDEYEDYSTVYTDIDCLNTL